MVTMRVDMNGRHATVCVVFCLSEISKNEVR